ncbi:MFS transporter [Streptomyces xanthii]|uniref:MFS transporter n=1 Tax=Streptomyces xanthii TaxID=2768069 RepID=A0A7H1B9F3_9ACTN|nr:MFS transporter [Streptomyces xanthii]QNS05358.1 MFS transporter [Streptomyces xanthii]
MADTDPPAVPRPPTEGAGPVTTREAQRTVHPHLVSPRLRWQIFAVTWIAYAGFYFVRQAFSVAKLGILDDPLLAHTLSERVLGVIDAIYLAAYAVGQFVWGAWSDRFGPRRVVITGMIGAIGAACLMGASSALLVFGGAMVIQGLAQSAGWAPLCKNMGAFFPVAERGRVLGIWSTNYAFGGLAAPPFLGWLAYSVFDSWQAAFFCGAASLAVVLLLFVLFQRDAPEPGSREEKEPGAEPTRRGGLALYRSTLRDPMVLTLGAAYFLLKPARYAILLWGPVLVSDRLPHVDKVGATVIPVAFGAAGVLAPIAVGWVSDRLFQSRRVPAAVLSLALLTVVLGLFMPLTATDSVGVMVALLAVIGLAVYAADSMISCVAAVDFGTEDGAGTAAGLVNGCGSVGAILGGLLPGFLSGSSLFLLFSVAALLAGLVMLPHWNRRPRTAAAQ